MLRVGVPLPRQNPGRRPRMAYRVLLPRQNPESCVPSFHPYLITCKILRNLLRSGPCDPATARGIGEFRGLLGPKTPPGRLQTAFYFLVVFRCLLNRFCLHLPAQFGIENRPTSMKIRCQNRLKNNAFQDRFPMRF